MLQPIGILHDLRPDLGIDYAAFLQSRPKMRKYMFWFFQHMSYSNNRVRISQSLSTRVYNRGEKLVGASLRHSDLFRETGKDFLIG